MTEQPAGQRPDAGPPGARRTVRSTASGLGAGEPDGEPAQVLSQALQAMVGGSARPTTTDAGPATKPDVAEFHRWLLLAVAVGLAVGALIGALSLAL